jgi:hypothetical protein
MIGDHYRDKWKPDSDKWWPGSDKWPIHPHVPYNPVGPSQAEFDKLKAEVAELVKLLKRAKKYDKDNGEPDCELDEKMALLRKMAKLVGVDLDASIATAKQ